MSPRQIVMRGILVGLLASTVGAGALFAYVHWYTRSDRILPGVRVGGMPVGGLRARDAHDRLLTAGLGNWSAQTAVHQASALGRRGTVWQRTRLFLDGVIHGYHVPLLSRSAGEVPDTRAIPAGPPLVRSAGAAALLPLRGQKATAPASARYQMARFTTPILAADPGRVQNISLAVEKINGTEVAPGQVFSFNDRVGPRDAAHGWALASEIYQGDYVLGYGGGICQVSSTLYNTVLLGGMDVVLRHHHDRPLQYVAPGRDATVVWNVLDFQFRNSRGVPVVVGARVLDGQPKRIEVTLHGPQPLPDGSVRIEEGARKYWPPEMVEIPDPSLPAHARKVVDEGRSGIEVKIYRVVREGERYRRELVSHDRYLPKPGRVRVGIGNEPGADRILNPGIR